MTHGRSPTSQSGLPLHRDASACDLCGSTQHDERLPGTIRRSLEHSDFSVLGEQREHHRIVRCRSCRLVFADPTDAVPELHAKYRTLDVESYLAEQTSRRRTCEADVAVLRTYVPQGRVLDVGCSAGLFLSCLPPQFEPHGIEPGEKGAEHARRLVGQSAVFQGTVESADFPAQCFDAVTMWDVIEHVASPRACLTRIAEWLQPRGYLFIVTPDFGSRFARVCGGRWPHLIRQHLYYFEHDTMARLLSDCGFEQVYVGTYSRYFTIGYLLQRARLVPSWLPRVQVGWLDRLSHMRVPVNLGDAMFVVARRSERATPSGSGE